MYYDRVLDRLAGVHRARRGWAAKCPAHDDRTPSLTISLGDQGQVLLYCFAGCALERILDRLQLTVRDLYPGAPMDLTDVHREALNLLRAQQRRRQHDQGAMADADCWAVIRHARALATRLGPDSEQAWELLEQAAALETMMHNHGVGD